MPPGYFNYDNKPQGPEKTEAFFSLRWEIYPTLGYFNYGPEIYPTLGYFNYGPETPVRDLAKA
jgi:hypothetical protein